MAQISGKFLPRSNSSLASDAQSSWCNCAGFLSLSIWIRSSVDFHGFRNFGIFFASRSCTLMKLVWFRLWRDRDTLRLNSFLWLLLKKLRNWSSIRFCSSFFSFFLLIFSCYQRDKVVYQWMTYFIERRQQQLSLELRYLLVLALTTRC